MKEIIELEGKEYLSQTYKLASVYKKYLIDTGASTIAKRKPELTGNETDDEKYQKIVEQTVKNVEDVNQLLYEENAEMTEKLLPYFVVLEDGEQLPSTKKLTGTMIHALNDKDFMDFLKSLM